MTGFLISPAAECLFSPASDLLISPVPDALFPLHRVPYFLGSQASNFSGVQFPRSITGGKLKASDKSCQKTHPVL